MGLLDIEDIPFKKKSVAKLTGQATRLLKQNGRRKKIRRGSGIKKKLKKQKAHQLLMEQYRKQKIERARMFVDFKRLIAE